MAVSLWHFTQQSCSVAVGGGAIGSARIRGRVGGGQPTRPKPAVTEAAGKGSQERGAKVAYGSRRLCTLLHTRVVITRGPSVVFSSAGTDFVCVTPPGAEAIGRGWSCPRCYGQNRLPA